MSSLLTVIVPTYNRPTDLIRTIKFLRHRALPLSIIVADGSDLEHSSQNARCQELGKGISYFHVPPIPTEDTATNYRRRALRALEQVETPYVAFCGDDDLLVPENAVDAAEFLENNPGYVGCHGVYPQFEYVQDTIKIPGIEYQGAAIDADQIDARLLQLFSRYKSPYYAVFRPSVLHLSFERAKGILSPLWGEIYHSTSAVVAGKIHRSSSIFCLRNIGNPPHYRAETAFGSFGDWIAADIEGFLAHYTKYRSCVLDWAAATDKQRLRRTLDMAFITYIVSEFNLSRWTDQCSRIVTDEKERQNLRSRTRGKSISSDAAPSPSFDTPHGPRFRQCRTRLAQQRSLDRVCRKRASPALQSQREINAGGAISIAAVEFAQRDRKMRTFASPNSEAIRTDVPQAEEEQPLA